MPRLHASKRTLLSLALLGAAAGCGGSSTSPLEKQENAFTASEALMVASAILDEINNALDNATDVGGFFNVVPVAASLSSVPTTKTQTVSSNCTAGGTIGGSFTYTEDISTNGTGTFVGSFTATPRGCKVSTGSRLIAVDGNLTYTFDWTLTQSAQTSRFKWRGVGDFSWEGGNCKMDYTVDLSGTSGQSSVSGSVCGVNLNGLYLRRPPR